MVVAQTRWSNTCVRVYRGDRDKFEVDRTRRQTLAPDVIGGQSTG